MRGGERMAITLRAARVNVGLTQAQAAKEIGVEPNTISRWELGTSFPQGRFIDRICEVYGRSYDDIIFLPSNSALSVKGEQ